MRSQLSRLFSYVCAVCALFGLATSGWSQSSSTSNPDLSWITDEPRPDFSGVWAPVASGMEESWVQVDSGRNIEVRQDENRLIVTELTGDGTGTQIYELDGSESRNSTRTGAGDVWETVSRARWLEGAIVIETTTITPNGSFEGLTTYYRGVDGRLNVSRLGPEIRSSQIMTNWIMAYELQT